MASYCTISIDKQTKEKAAKRAKKDSMAISVITRILLNDYAEGRIVIGSRQALTINGFTEEFEQAILLAEKEPASAEFNSAKDAITFLHKESKKHS